MCFYLTGGHPILPSLRLLFCRSECFRRPGTVPAPAELYRDYRLSPEHGLQFAAWPIQQCRMADPTTPYGRPDVWPGPPRGREITGKLRFTPLNVLLTQGLRPPHMHTAIRKTARSLTCLLRNFCPFIPLLIVLFPLLPVIPPRLHPSCQMFQLPPIVVRLSGNICSRSDESPPGARSSLVIGEPPIIAIGHPDNRCSRSSCLPPP